jgi:hypothetical protein
MRLPCACRAFAWSCGASSLARATRLPALAYACHFVLLCACAAASRVTPRLVLLVALAVIAWDEWTVMRARRCFGEKPKIEPKEIAE